MIIKMLKSTHGSPNGISIVHYEKDNEYNIPDKLADIFINQMRVAIKVELVPVKEKAIQASPQNKAIENVPVNKVVIKESAKSKIKRGRK